MKKSTSKESKTTPEKSNTAKARRKSSDESLKAFEEQRASGKDAKGSRASSKKSRVPTKRSQMTKRIVIGLAIALVLVYIIFVFITTNFLGNNNLVAETIYRAKAYETIESRAIIVRNEEYLDATANGVLVYDIDDGGKVTANGVIATAYASQEDVAAIQQIEQLDERIEYLESIDAVSNSPNVGIDTINAQINERMITLIKGINSRDFGSLTNDETNLLTSILRKQIITGEQGNFKDKIDALKAERDALKANTATPVGKIKTTSAGYFVSKVDGYEGVFDVSALDEITAKDVEDAKPQQVDESAYVGKIIKDSNWYILCPITSDEANSLTHASSSVKVRLPSVLDEAIPAKVLYVNNMSNDNKAIAVLQCDYMNDALSYLRRDNVEIIVNEYEGLKIPMSALHDDYVTYTVSDAQGKDVEQKEKVQGVYVEYGAELVFKQVAIMYSGDGYVICNEEPASGVLKNGSTVSLYDKVVVEGGDLFDGKIIA